MDIQEDLIYRLPGLPDGLPGWRVTRKIKDKKLAKILFVIL